MKTIASSMKEAQALGNLGGVNLATLESKDPGAVNILSSSTIYIYIQNSSA